MMDDRGIERYRGELNRKCVTLAEVLNPEEMDGVVAHEAGHVRYGHLWFYLMFFLGYMCILAVFFRFVWTGLDWLSIANPELYQTLSSSKIIPAVLTCCVLVLLIVYFRLLFGALSRAFERQADAYALESIGRPEPLISALERISLSSGDIRDLPSWHHGSIADRVAFLAASAADPSHLAAHHGRVKRLTRYSTLGIVISAALAVGVHAGPIDDGLREGRKRIALEPNRATL